LKGEEMAINYLYNLIDRIEESSKDNENILKAIDMDSIDDLRKNDTYRKVLINVREELSRGGFTNLLSVWEKFKSFVNDDTTRNMFALEKSMQLTRVLSKHREDLIKCLKRLDSMMRAPGRSRRKEDLARIGITNYSVRRSNKHANFMGETLEVEELPTVRSNGTVTSRSEPFKEPYWTITFDVYVENMHVVHINHEDSVDQEPFNLMLPWGITYTVEFKFNTPNDSDGRIRSNEITNALLDNLEHIEEWSKDPIKLGTNILRMTGPKVIATQSMPRLEEYPEFPSNHPYLSRSSGQVCVGDFSDDIAEAVQVIDMMSIATTMKQWLSVYDPRGTNPQVDIRHFLFSGLPENAGQGVAVFESDQDALDRCWGMRVLNNNQISHCDSIECVFRPDGPNSQICSGYASFTRVARGNTVDGFSIELDEQIRVIRQTYPNVLAFLKLLDSDWVEPIESCLRSYNTRAHGPLASLCVLQSLGTNVMDQHTTEFLKALLRDINVDMGYLESLQECAFTESFNDSENVWYQISNGDHDDAIDRLLGHVMRDLRIYFNHKSMEREIIRSENNEQT
tara:strand:- start:5814 stop:7514 length:1701 start_codon:yes stop_codon:yes gene_type:complete